MVNGEVRSDSRRPLAEVSLYHVWSTPRGLFEGTQKKCPDCFGPCTIGDTLELLAQGDKLKAKGLEGPRAGQIPHMDPGLGTTTTSTEHLSTLEVRSTEYGVRRTPLWDKFSPLFRNFLG